MTNSFVMSTTSMSHTELLSMILKNIQYKGKLIILNVSIVAFIAQNET